MLSTPVYDPDVLPEFFCERRLRKRRPRVPSSAMTYHPGRCRLRCQNYAGGNEQFDGVLQPFDPLLQVIGSATRIPSEMRYRRPQILQSLLFSSQIAKLLFRYSVSKLK
jgi:hypothetical protein